MTDDEGLTPEQEAAREVVHGALRDTAETLGPQGQGGMAGPWLLSEWVLVCSWTHAESGEATLTRLGVNGGLAHHRNGLLHEALYGDWSDPE